MAQANEEAEKFNWHWRNTMRPVRFFNFDARAAVPWCLMLVYARLITLLVAILTTFIFWLLERSGLSLPAALRNLRRWITGDYRPAHMPRRYKKFRDFG